MNHIKIVELQNAVEILRRKVVTAKEAAAANQKPKNGIRIGGSSSR